MIFLLIANIIFWIIYKVGLKTLRRNIKSRLMSDPAYAARFRYDVLTRHEEYQFILVGFIIFAGRFVVVADLLIGLFFIFGPH